MIISQEHIKILTKLSVNQIIKNKHQKTNIMENKDGNNTKIVNTTNYKLF